MRISLQRALLLLLVGALALALVPAGVLLERRLAAELEQRARAELAMVPRLFEDRNTTRAEMLTMHAGQVAGAPGVAAGLRTGDRERAIEAAGSAVSAADERPVVVDPGGAAWVGPEPGADLVGRTRRGELPVEFVTADSLPWLVALAPVEGDGGWLGAAGVAVPLDEAAVATLAGLTHSEVVVDPPGGAAFGTIGPDLAAPIATEAAAAGRADGSVWEVRVGDGARYWIATVPLGRAGRLVFARSAERELAPLPRLRLAAAAAAGVALLLALLLGSLAAAAVSRPVQALAGASARLAEGDFDAPLPSTNLREVERVSRAFDEMRRSLARRLAELEEANRELAERQERLQALQGELIQRDRLASSGRLVTELAHEIRNPVASVRNCLEVVERRLGEDPEGREFAAMAIDELMRMHRLAEQVLELNRPLDPEAGSCDPAAVARQVAELVALGAADGRWPVEVREDPGAPRAAIGPDGLKQTLLNLVRNAQEAMPEGGTIEIRVSGDDGTALVEVADRGGGIAPDVLPRLFDPFFTTKGEVSGVGLGLFVAEGIVRRHGGRLRAANRPNGAGAVLTIELRAAVEGDG